MTAVAFDFAPVTGPLLDVDRAVVGGDLALALFRATEALEAAVGVPEPRAFEVREALLDLALRVRHLREWTRSDRPMLGGNAVGSYSTAYVWALVTVLDAATS